MHAKILEWGNSYGIRLTKAEAERLGLRPGDEVIVEVKAKPDEKVDLSGVRTMSLGGDLAERHDEVDWA